MRVFCFAEGLYDGKLGGGGKGVTYRLFEANKRFKLISDMCFIFGNAAIYSNGKIEMFESDEVSRGGIGALMHLYFLLDDRIHFSSEDLYIFHDMSCYYALKHVADQIDHTVCVYHGQGSLFYEADYFGLEPDEEYRSKANKLTEYVLSCAQMICFPSEGARQAFISTSDKDICELLENCEGRILYNGCDPVAAKDVCAYSELFERINRKKGQGRIFISVASLNKAKGVERLTDFFEDYGREHEYLWIIVGDGVMNKTLEKRIGKIKDNVLWVKEPLPNDIVVAMYERSDYYILAHRLSIFDFATIEAMHMGVIPVLTPVGGNMEMICENNGFFLDDNDIGNSKEFALWEKNADIDGLKAKNKALARDCYSDRRMLERYVEVISEFEAQNEKKDFLIIVPDLELNGAQVVLNELLDLTFFAGKTIDMISPTKGSFGRIYKEKGINVIIRPYIRGDEAFRRHLVNDYKSVFINTSSCNLYLMYFLNTGVPVYFWLHETFTQLSNTNAVFLDPGLYSSNIKLFGVTEDVRTGIHKRYGKVDMELLPMPVADMRGISDFDTGRLDNELLDKLEGKVLFFLPAAYTVIKGQDILLQAVLGLPEEYRKKAHFLLCGYRLPGQQEYYDSLKRISEKMPDVTMLDEIGRDEVYFWYSVSDCVLAPSRVDATPTSIVEAMMFRKIALISDATGISRYLEDCVSAFIFPSENIEELKKRLMLLIHDYGAFDEIGERAGEVYENNFSTDRVNELLIRYMGHGHEN